MVAKRFAAVVVREWGGHWNGLAIAPLLALAAWLAGRLGNSADDRAAITAVTSALLAAPFALILTWFIGATMITREVAERRLTFDLARPLRPATLWFGKLTANTLLVLATAAVAGAFALVHWPLWGLSALALLPVILVIAHVETVAARGGGVWLLADFAALFVFALILLGIAALFADQHPVVALVMALLSLFALLVALVTSPVTGIRHGAFDLRVFDRAQRRTLWLRAAMLIVALDTTYWLYLDVIPVPSNAEIAMFTPSHHWIALTRRTPGRADWYRSEVREIGTQRRIDLGVTTLGMAGIVESADRRHLFITLRTGYDSSVVVHIRTDGRLRREALPALGRASAVAPDGSLIVLDGDSSAPWIFDVPRRRFVRQIPEGGQFAFIAPRRLRSVAWIKHDLVLRDLDVAGGQSTSRVLLHKSEDSLWHICMNDAADRILAYSGTSLILLDSEGHTLATFPGTRGSGIPSWPAFLADGRIAFTLSPLDNRSTLVYLVSRDGSVQHAWSVPAKSDDVPYVASDPSTDTLLLDHMTEHGTPLLLDLRNGSVRLLPDVRPLGVFPSIPLHGDAGMYALKGRDLVRIDPARGTTLLVQREAEPARRLHLY